MHGKQGKSCGIDFWEREREREREREGDKKPAQEIKNYEAVGYLANWDRVSGCARVWGLGCGPRLLLLWLYLHIYTVHNSSLYIIPKKEKKTNYI